VRVERVWLIRHGQSESNAGLPSGDPPAIPLTVLGRQQAEAVAAGFGEPPALIVTSPYVRARQTAEPSERRYPDAAREEWAVQEFTFLGELHGRMTTVAERAPYAQAYWDRADPGYAVSGAESFASLMGRSAAFISRLAARPAGPVAVFSHGHFIRVVAWSLMTGRADPTPDAMHSFRDFCATYYVPNGAVVELRTFPGTGRGPVLLGGSTFHLPAS
jgi:2,3-bisphosphoglycerate-dependent phosphoglycerate mutase